MRSSPFSVRTERLLRAFCPAFAPDGEDWPDATETAVRYLRNIVSGFDPVVQRVIVQGLWALEFLPLTLGKRRRLSKLPLAQRRQFVERLSHSRLASLRMIAARMQGIVLMGYYVDPRVREKIGFRPRFQESLR